MFLFNGLLNSSSSALYSKSCCKGFKFFKALTVIGKVNPVAMRCLWDRKNLVTPGYFNLVIQLNKK